MNVDNFKLRFIVIKAMAAMNCIIIIREWPWYSKQMLMMCCMKRLKLWWVIYGTFSLFSSVQAINRHKDLKAAEESERRVFEGRFIIGRFTWISKLDTYPLWDFMVFARSKECSTSFCRYKLLSLKKWTVDKPSHWRVGCLMSPVDNVANYRFDAINSGAHL